MSSKLLYFGHPINVYDKALEGHLLAVIGKRFTEWTIENPNQPRHLKGYQRRRLKDDNGMLYFFEEVLPACRGGIFLPFRDGTFGHGVYGEAEFLAKGRWPIWQISHEGRIIEGLPDASLKLGIEETRDRIRCPNGQPKPY